ncbi:MAG: hypothetical protein FWH53_01475 [Leptospirales bacterium]|nr:hypothetical protein [Leptospirales bacterium]
MKEIDKTKENIKIDEMDENERNDLLKKFTDAGGQIIDERATKKNLAIDREKQKEHQRKLDKHYRDKKSSQKKTNIGASDKNSSASNAPTSPVFDQFRIRIRLKFLGITGFSTVFFKKSFFKKFVNYYKPSLITIQMVYLSLFKKNPQSGNKIVRALDKISPRYYELIEMTGELYEENLIDQIIEVFINYPNIQQPLSELKAPLIGLYRDLYILKPYENVIYNAFERAIGINSTFSERKDDWNFKDRDLKNSLFFIFEKLYPRLHTLFCYYQGILYNETDKEIDNILSIAKHEKPGARIKQDLNSAIQVEEQSDEKPDSEKTKEIKVNEVDNSIKEGLKLMYSLDNKILRLQYDKKGEFELLSITDKVLITYLIFKEFENEYSFILTTNKIKYNIDFSTRIKIDYRTKMQDMFNKLNKCQEAFKNYYGINEEYDRIYRERPADNNQYIAYSKKLDELIEKKNIAGITYRTTIKTFMDDLAADLNILMNDMNSEQKFIANPQDLLEFNPAIEGEKKLDRKKIYDAITILYNFASAFSYRISLEGDLYGKLEFDEDEKLINTENGSSPENADDNNETKKSIFDELDDSI